MPRSDDPIDVALVAGTPEHGEFEELAEPRRGDWPWLQRVRIPLAVLAAAAILIVLVVRARSGHTPSATAQRPTPSSTGSFAITFPRPDVLPSGVDRTGLAVLPADPTRCPLTLSCVTTADAPAAVLAAIRDAFPGARQLATTTVLSRAGLVGGLWFRQVNARAGQLDILVRIQQARRTRDGRAGTTITGSRSITYVLTLSHSLTVQVQVDAPRRQAPSVLALRRLTLDRRLFVPA